MEQRILITEDVASSLQEAVGTGYDGVFLLVDTTTQRLCWPLVSSVKGMEKARKIVIPAGDSNKTLSTLSHVWQGLQQGGATRYSLLVCLGGGMVTDLGGFAASTFKRGIAFVNVPTTLLSMVDASVGGKTGINFGGLKNEVGTFCEARSVIVSTQFLKTLDRENLLSGYAEMLKHGLISDLSTWSELLKFDIENPDWKALSSMLSASIAVKERIVTEDPHEHGIRKALNLGHTVGHAIESWSMEPQGNATAKTPASRKKPLLHGYAVAYGLVCELYLSSVKRGFPAEKMRQTVRFIKEHYGAVPALSCDEYPRLLELMRHDKKNQGGQINFTLLSDIGEVHTNQTATDADICEALDFLREG
ncbi:MAG: 3-dehydroquinate synthase [Prevotella sp.]|nr:3-dehydroquinate synthase [Prevotella sp.]